MDLQLNTPEKKEDEANPSVTTVMLFAPPSLPLPESTPRSLPSQHAAVVSVFVYGTLKRGEANYPYWIQPFLSSCSTSSSSSSSMASSISTSVASTSSPSTTGFRFVSCGRTVHCYPFFINPVEYGSSPCVLNIPSTIATTPIPSSPDSYPDTAATSTAALSSISTTSGHRVYGEVYEMPEAYVLQHLHRLEGIERGVYSYQLVPVELIDDDIETDHVDANAEDDVESVVEQRTNEKLNEKNTTRMAQQRTPQIRICGMYFREELYPKSSSNTCSSSAPCTSSGCSGVGGVNNGGCCCDRGWKALKLRDRFVGKEVAAELGEGYRYVVPHLKPGSTLQLPSPSSWWIL